MKVEQRDGNAETYVNWNSRAEKPRTTKACRGKSGKNKSINSWKTDGKDKKKIFIHFELRCMSVKMALVCPRPPGIIQGFRVVLIGGNRGWWVVCVFIFLFFIWSMGAGGHPTIGRAFVTCRFCWRCRPKIQFHAAWHKDKDKATKDGRFSRFPARPLFWVKMRAGKVVVVGCGNVQCIREDAGKLTFKNVRTSLKRISN